MKIEYKIEEVEPNVYAVIVPDNYHRPMLFCRVQEFYESPNPKFRGKNFNIWDYIEWYSRQKRGAFTYAFDWGGFNIPLEVAWNCYEGKNGVRIMPEGYKSPYDNIMTDIISDIQIRMFDKSKQRDLHAYIIGAADTKGWTFKHEVCHGLYYINKKYRELVDEVTQTIPLKDYIKFKQNLIKMGYTEDVIDDEIQAYLNFGHDWPAFTKGVSKRLCNNLHKTYQSIYTNASITH
jgi:hypothetical protein